MPTFLIPFLADKYEIILDIQSNPIILPQKPVKITSHIPKYPYIGLTHILHIMCSDPKRVLLLAAIMLTAAGSNLRS